MSIQNFEIGLTYAGLVNVETLAAVPNMAPASRHLDYSETAQTLDGGAFARGSAQIVWTWGNMYEDMYTALRAICPAGSVSVFIRSRPESGAESTTTDYKYYQAKMIWPELESLEWKTKMYQPFELKFNHVVEYTP